MTVRAWMLVLVACASVTGGCGAYRAEADRFVNLTDGRGYDRGLVVCLGGAGGVTGAAGRIARGLLDGGVQGAFEEFQWSSGFVLADQADVTANRHKAAALAGRLARYMDEHPDCPVHLVGVSAGTGLVVWAAEDLPADRRVENVFLVASSLSSRYDLGPALKKVSGQLCSYYSGSDLVLGLLVPLTGAVDQQSGLAGGLRGFQPPTGADASARSLYARRLVQVGWTSADAAYGHIGDHLGGTQPAFVRQYLAALAWSRSAEAVAEDEYRSANGG